MTSQITVIGLNQIGASIGLALAEHKARILRCAHDNNAARMRELKNMGAFDKTFIHLPEAVQGADLILLSLPIDLIKDALTLIARKIKPGAAVIDTSPLHTSISAWAREILPGGTQFISMTPVLNPIHLDERMVDWPTPHADLFEKSDFIIAPAFNTPPAAIRLATELAEMLKGKPFFVDPVEADGLVAEEELLPKLVASAYLRSLVDQPGWKDGRRFASKTFFRLASLSKGFDEEEYFGISSLMNKESTSRAMGTLINSLQELQQLIDTGDEEGLRLYLASSRHGFETWYDQRISSNWEAEKKEEIPPARDILGRLFGGKPRKKPEK